MLEDFTIKNFRGIKELTLPSLKRVNLLVGKNGVGKTSVLEAVDLWAQGGSPKAINGIFAQRQEPTKADLLFFDSIKALSVGPTDSPVRVTPAVRRGLEAVDVDGTLKFLDAVDVSGRPAAAPKAQVFWIPSIGLDGKAVSEAWIAHLIDGIDRDTTHALSLLIPDVDKTMLAGQVPYVEFKDGLRAPLKRLGDGAMRIFGMALGVASAKGGILLIDEIENGIHYSAQVEVWKFLIAAADKLNVQVFATTHSRDTVNALAGASHEDDHIVYRLERYKGELQAVAFEAVHLDTVAEYEVEIR